VSASRALGIDLSDGTAKAVLLVRRGRRALLRAAWRVELDPRGAGPADALAAVAELLAARGESLAVDQPILKFA